MKPATCLILLALLTRSVCATEYHVSLKGNDDNDGSRRKPFKTISAAARLAQPGDVITVHAGTYRERVNPPRGGVSDTRRIVYQAARGETVEIKGSEVVTNWMKVQEDVWKVTLPASFFGAFNPYTNLIHGDWFDPRGRQHHTGAVYLNGEWLTEAAKLDEVLMPGGGKPAWLGGGQDYVLNVAWLQTIEPGKPGRKIPAAAFAAKNGTQNAPCSEGGECIGFIAHGHWVRYDSVDFGKACRALEIRAASASQGGAIEVRLNSPEGQLLGTCAVPNTGGWQTWVSFKVPIKPVSGFQSLCLVFKGQKPDAINPQLWFAQADANETTIWAQFKGVNPNEQLVEINVRQTVFYPDQPGRDFITVRGFALRQAATPWAPPTAEQIGLLGTHWSKGWIIENNVVSHSVCSGIALGKYGDRWDNTSANSAEGYVKTIERALENGWNKETIGHHVVRNNTISHCEQAGIVGSLGAAFSTVTGNTIHDIHVRRLFSGAEMAGIKFHAAIDTVISHNHIYRTCLGLWLDWMAQGTRISGNLFHDNAGQDMFVEVDHGPFVADNNLYLSGTSLLDMSEGGAYAHNLFAGQINTSPEPNRETPYHPAHTTKVAGLSKIKGGDDRFYNNIFIGRGADTTKAQQASRKDSQWTAGYGLWMYDQREYPLQARGNVFYNGARAGANQSGCGVESSANPGIRLRQDGETWVLDLAIGAELRQADSTFVTTELLGKARIPDVAYENADGSPLKVSTDFLGKKRKQDHPTPGPFENPGSGPLKLKVWGKG